MLISSFEHLPFYFASGTALDTGDSKMNEKRIFFLRVLNRVWGKISVNSVVDTMIKVCSECREGLSVTGVGERCWEGLSGGETLI